MLMAAVLIAFAAMLAGCPGGGSDADDAAQGPTEPHELMDELYQAVRERDRERFMACFIGEEATRAVFEQVFEVITRVDRLREAMQRRHGHEDAMLFSLDNASTDSLPGMDLHQRRWRQPGAAAGDLRDARDGGDEGGDAEGRLRIASPLWERPLYLVKREGRWFVDAEATIDDSAFGAHPNAAAILQRLQRSLAEALDRAYLDYTRRNIPREQVLANLLDAHSRIELETLRRYLAVRDQQRREDR